MASPFQDNSLCEGVGCLRKSRATYYVAEKQQLCDDCAIKKGRNIKDIGSKRAGWTCNRHGKPIEFFCQAHNEALCQSCSTVSHKPCALKELEDALSQKRQVIADLISKTTDKRQVWRTHADVISRQQDAAQKHFATVEREIKQLIRAAMSKKIERGKIERDAINKEFDEEIRRITEKREERLKQSITAEANLREPIENSQRELLNTLSEIKSRCTENFKECHQQTNDVMDVLENALESFDGILLLNDEDLVMCRPQLIAALEGTLGCNTDSEFVEEISRVSLNVRFVKGAEGKEYKGAIEWPRSKWEHTDTIDIASKTKHPCLIGYTSADRTVVLKDGSVDGVMYVTSVDSKKTDKFRLHDGARITSCKPLNETAVVCAKCCDGCIDSGGLLSGSVALYDKQWKLIRDFSVPKETTDHRTFVEVAVRKRSGVIVAVERNQSHIHAINPNNGKIVKTIKCKDRIRMRAILPCGDIVAQRVPFDNTVLVIDREGASREIAHSQTILNATVDSRTRDIYVACHEPARDRFVISRLSGRDWGETTRVMTLPVVTGLSKEKRYNHVVESNLVFTPHGQMIVCDGRKILVYKKTFSFQQTST